MTTRSNTACGILNETLVPYGGGRGKGEEERERKVYWSHVLSQGVPQWLVPGPFWAVPQPGQDRGLPQPDPDKGRYLGQVRMGVPWPGIEYPLLHPGIRFLPAIGHQTEYLIQDGRYASCVHAGGLSCIWVMFLEMPEVVRSDVVRSFCRYLIVV